jgi:nucleoside-diphosphate-sugar epimerase
LTQVLKRFRYDSLLYLSTTRVYRHAPETNENAVLQVRPADPDDLYNITKLAGEALCLALQSPTVRVARLSNVFGPDDRSNNFLTAVMQEARGGSVTIQTDPDSEKDYVALSDVVQLSETIATSGRHRLYNVASGRNISHRTVADLVRQHTRATVHFAPNAPKQVFQPIDIELIRREFNAKPLPFEAAFSQLFQPSPYADTA